MCKQDIFVLNAEVLKTTQVKLSHPITKENLKKASINKNFSSTLAWENDYENFIFYDFWKF